MKRSLTALIAATLVAATLTTTPASAAPVSKPVVKCEFTPTPENPAAKPVRIPSANARAKGTVDVYFVTNYGPFVVRMDRANAPCGVHNFVHLVKSRFYDFTQCFRLTNSARLGVLQCGETYPRGTVAYGNQGPGTNGSEFFVVHSFANIAPNYTVLGHVIAGMSTFDRMVAAGIADPDQDGPPVKPIRIYKVWAH